MAFTYKTSIKSIGADYERKESFYAKSVVIDTTKRKLPTAGIIMDSSEDNIIATTTDESHVFIIGGTGNGKTRRVIVPSVFSIAKTGSSLVLTDPKGELYRQTSDYLKEYGYDVMVVNFRNPSKGNRWNPFSIIEDFYRRGTEEFIDKATIMLKDITDIIGKNVSSNNDKYWEQAAMSAFMGVALMLLEYGEPGSLTFENISVVTRDFVNDLNKKGTEALKFYNSLPPFSMLKSNLSGLHQPDAARTVNNILGVFNTMLFQYTNQKSLIDFMSRSEADFTKLAEKPTALFMILPDDSTALYPLATVMIKQLYTTLLQIADSNVKNKGRLNNKVTFLLDEFGTLCGAGNGFIPDFPVMMTAARSRGIRFAIVCQSIEQLCIRYSQQEANTISSNCKVWIYMNSRDYEFLQQLQNLVGEYVSPYTNMARPLISLQDLQKMPLGEVLILNDFCGPYIGHLKDFTEYDFGSPINMDESAVPEDRVEFHPQKTTFHDLFIARKEKDGIEYPDDEDEKPHFRQFLFDRPEVEEEPETEEEEPQPVILNPEGPVSPIEGVNTKTVPSSYIENNKGKSDYSFKILEDVLLYRKWEDRESVVEFMNNLVKNALDIPEYPDELKEAFSEGSNKLNSLSFEEMKEIISILSDDDEE